MFRGPNRGTGDRIDDAAEYYEVHGSSLRVVTFGASHVTMLVGEVYKLTVREPDKRMVIIVNGRRIELSREDSVQRKQLLREATAAMVALYRPALERLEDA